MFVGHDHSIIKSNSLTTKKYSIREIAPVSERYLTSICGCISSIQLHSPKSLMIALCVDIGMLDSESPSKKDLTDNNKLASFTLFILGCCFLIQKSIQPNGNNLFFCLTGKSLSTIASFESAFIDREVSMSEFKLA